MICNRSKFDFQNVPSSLKMLPPVPPVMAAAVSILSGLQNPSLFQISTQFRLDKFVGLAHVVSVSLPLCGTKAVELELCELLWRESQTRSQNDRTQCPKKLQKTVRARTVHISDVALAWNKKSNYDIVFPLGPSFFLKGVGKDTLRVSTPTLASTLVDPVAHSLKTIQVEPV